MPDFRIPKLCHHKASGQAVVRLVGVDHYLGPWGTATSRTEYDRVVAEFLASGRQCPRRDGGGGSGGGRKGVGVDADGELTIVELIAAFWEHAKDYYRGPDREVTSELDCFRDTLRPLRRLYGATPASAFGPLALKAVRQVMIEEDLCRTNINRRVGRIRRMFKWATENELVPPAVLHGLQAVSGLKASRCAVRESVPVKPVADEIVEATLVHASRQVAAMARLQLLTGMRSGEVVLIRGVDLEQQSEPWTYRPTRHKTAYLGHDRVIFFGPQAQAILRPFLKDDASAYLFSPSDADEERRREQHAARRTPLSCGNKPGTNVRRKPKKKPGVRYTANSYAHAIKYACRQAFPVPASLAPRQLPNGRSESQAAWQRRLNETEKQQVTRWQREHHWHPHQLRHSCATNLRRSFGLEPAQVILGHKTLSVTQVYAERDVEAAKRIMRDVG